MKRVWERAYILRANDFDKFDRIKPSAVLELFQDAAGQHAEEIGVGFGEMIKRDYLWVLVRIKFRILANPKSYQRVTVRTWPLVPERLSYRREYAMEDENGRRLIEGSSEWVVMHREKRRLVADPNLYPFADGFCTEKIFEGKLKKIGDFEPVGQVRTVCAGFSELDVNGHVNNTKYANYVLDAAPPAKEEQLAVFQIDYRKEVLEGTQLRICCKKEKSEVLAKGIDEEGSTMFVCGMEYGEL